MLLHMWRLRMRVQLLRQADKAASAESHTRPPCAAGLKHLEHNCPGALEAPCRSRPALPLPGVQRKLLAPALDLLVRVKVYMEDEVLKSLVQDTFRAFPRLQVGWGGVVGWEGWGGVGAQLGGQISAGQSRVAPRPLPPCCSTGIFLAASPLSTHRQPCATKFRRCCGSRREPPGRPLIC